MLCHEIVKKFSKYELCDVKYFFATKSFKFTFNEALYSKLAILVSEFEEAEDEL